MANPTTIRLGLGTLTIDGRNVGILVGDVALSQELDTTDHETATDDLLDLAQALPPLAQRMDSTPIPVAVQPLLSFRSALWP